MNDLNKSGIYKITNNINGKCYIGLAKNIAQRWNQHRNFEVTDNSKNLYWAFREYGLKNFTFEVVMLCEENKLAYWEKHYISHFDSYKNGYNSSYGGEGGKTETLSDKYDINYNINISDNLTYESDTINQKHFKKYENKRDKKLSKYNAKIIARTAKNKVVYKIELKRDKKIAKIQLKIDYHAYEIKRIADENYSLYSKKYLPIKKFLEAGEWLDYSNEDFEYIKINTISSKIYQENKVKYKKYLIEESTTAIRFSKNNILFKINGLRDLKIELEQIRNINIYVSDDYIGCYFNNAAKTFDYLINHRFLSSDKPEMPESPLMIFYSPKQINGFISSLKRVLGK